MVGHGLPTSNFYNVCWMVQPISQVLWSGMARISWWCRGLIFTKLHGKSLEKFRKVGHMNRPSHVPFHQSNFPNISNCGAARQRLEVFSNHRPWANNPGDEPRNFYDRLTHRVERRNPFFSEGKSFGCRNQVDVPKMKWQIKSYGCLVLLPKS